MGEEEGGERWRRGKEKEEGMWVLEQVMARCPSRHQPLLVAF